MKILIITPIPTEYHAAREVFSAKEVNFSITEGMRVAEKRTKKNIITILSPGMGISDKKKLSPTIEYFQPDLLIDSGSCGSLDDSFRPGEWVIAAEVVNRKGHVVSGFQDEKGYEEFQNFKSSRILEVEKPVTDKINRAKLGC